MREEGKPVATHARQLTLMSEQPDCHQRKAIRPFFHASQRTQKAWTEKLQDSRHAHPTASGPNMAEYTVLIEFYSFGILG